jgi:hypothetical protein
MLDQSGLQVFERAQRLELQMFEVLGHHYGPSRRLDDPYLACGHLQQTYPILTKAA